jgi:hypothetical protein
VSGMPRGPRFQLELATTRDYRVPLSDDDREMEYGWQCIPVPPSDDPDWIIIDDSNDRKSVWVRLRADVEEAA